jgi:AAHS family 4-hydroxybenzoate transporter-like MFS transporter
MQSQALSQSVQVADIIDGCRFRGLPLVVSFFTVLTFVFDGFDIQGVAFVAPELLEQWGITRAALGPVLAAGLVGMAAGSLLLGPLGDRTGVGIGGSIPSATALMMEFAPVRVRNLAVSITVVGVPIGGVLGAEVAARLLPTFGWEAVFVAGAILPAALAAAIWLLMPESPKFLARRPARSAELASMLNRLVGEARYGANDRFIIDEHTGGRGEGFMALLAAAFRRDTILIWLAFFTSLLSVYSFFNWLPTVLTGVGLPITAALRGSLVFNLGGVIGALIIATCMTRFGSKPVIVTFGIAAIALTLRPLCPRRVRLSNRLSRQRRRRGSRHWSGRRNRQLIRRRSRTCDRQWRHDVLRGRLWSAHDNDDQRRVRHSPHATGPRLEPSGKPQRNVAHVAMDGRHRAR